MTPIQDYKREDARYDGARKIHEWMTVAFVLFVLFCGLAGAAIVGDELQTLRVEVARCGAVESMGMGR